MRAPDSSLAHAAKAASPRPLSRTHHRQASHASVVRQIFRAQLSRWSFGCGWLVLLLLHSLCAGFYAGAAWIYYIAHTSNLWWLPGGLAVSIPLEEYTAVAYVHLAVASIHALLALWMLVASVLSRQLAFGIIRRHRSTRPNRVWRFVCACLPACMQRTSAPRANQVGPAVGDLKTTSTPTSFRGHARRAVDTVFGRYGLFGVENAHYDVFYLVREVGQAVWQTSQAYWMSVLLTRHRLNQLFVTCIVLNCWSVPLLRFVWRKSENVIMERIVLLTADMVLDLMATIALPIALFVPYYRDYIPFIGDFSQANWYDPKWFINMVFEFRMLLVQSWGDMLFRLGFAANLLSCMEVVKGLLDEPRARAARSSRSHIVHTEQSNSTARPLVNPAPAPDTCASGPTTSDAAVPESTVQPASRTETISRGSQRSQAEIRVTKVAHAVLILFGAVVLALHLHATAKWGSELCVVDVRPWLTREPACLYFELNCARMNVSGSAHEFEALLRGVDTSALASLDIVHCPALEVSPRIRDFPNLIVLTLSFSSVATWDAAAALVNAHHTKLRNLNFYGTNFSDGALPPGVLSTTFPKQVTQVTIVYSNLESVPDDVDTKWTGLTYFYCERSRLRAFPTALTRLPIVDLSLVGNEIEDVPLEVFTNTVLFGIYLSANPIAVLPDGAIELPAKFRIGEFYNTELTALPSYFDDAFFLRGAFVGAGGSPICENMDMMFDDIAFTGSSTSSTDTGDAGGDDLLSLVYYIDCSTLSAQRITVIPFFRIKHTNLPDAS